MPEKLPKRLPGHYRGAFYCVDSEPRRPHKSMLQRVIDSLPIEKPLSRFTLTRLLFETKRAISIMQQLDKPSPDISFLRNEKSPYENPLLTFRRILNEGKKIQDEREQIEKLRARINDYAKKNKDPKT